jgi:hypothetical protein
MKKVLLILAGITLLTGVILFPFWQDHQQATIRDLVHDEEIVLQLTPLTNKLAKAIDGKQVVEPNTRSLFAEEVNVVDLLPGTHPTLLNDTRNGITGAKWLPGEGKTHSSMTFETSGIWEAFFQNANEITDSSFGFVTGSSVDDFTFESTLKFNAKGSSTDGHPVSYRGVVDVLWVSSEDSWKIKSWDTKSFSVTSRKEMLFRNRMAELFSEADYGLAICSIHEEKVVDYIAKGSARLPKREYAPFFQPESGYQHPAVSVVDINQDGWDDLFVTSLWGKCQLWVNERGEKFTEQSSQYGLDIDSCCTSALFADFDNDGDADLVLGRSLERSQLYWNEGSHYVLSPTELPYLVTSVTAADCNNDGLLDFYLCTYGPNGTAAKSNPEWMQKLVPEESLSKLKDALKKSHRYFNQAGPRNYLFINRGDRQFETAPADPTIDQYHNTYQASWADFDQDGDMDVYVCNDFAPDSLLRNDSIGDDGIPRFTDVSQELSADTMKGFGMGASWGDFDNDQQLDLFVTNMYSKAGKRVLSRFENVDERLHFSARGNLLFKQRDGEFKQLAGESDAFPVHQGGWAFGGQFIDLDNDAWLDLYVPNGFYSAPKAVDSEVDL